LDVGLGALGLGAERGELTFATLERRAHLPELVEHALVLGDTVAIELGDDRDRARRARQTAGVGRRQEKANVAGAPELVDFGKPRAEFWTNRCLFTLQAL